jgi:hypothetical protein
VIAPGVAAASTGNSVRIASSASGDVRAGSWADACGRKICIGDHPFVAVAHACEHMEEVGVQQRMDAFEHVVTPP